MLDSSSTIMMLSLGWGSLAIVYAVYAWKMRKLERRREDFKIYKLCLEAHQDAVDKFIDDDDAPLGLVRLLVTLQTAIGDREFARFIAFGLSDDGAEDSTSVRLVWEELYKLSQKRPDLAELFEKAFETGIVATLLREPETARLFKPAIGNLARDHRSGAAYVIRAQKKLGPFADDGCPVPA